jgi:integrase
MLSLAAAEERIPVVPKFPASSVQNARQGFFAPGRLEALLQHLGHKYAAMTRFAAVTGWRKEEARTLTWKQVDFAAGEVRLEVGTTKNGRGRIFPFAASPSLEALLREQREMTTRVECERRQIIPSLFHRTGVPVGVNWIKAWNKAAAKAGVPGKLFHDLRRRGSSALATGGRLSEFPSVRWSQFPESTWSEFPEPATSIRRGRPARCDCPNTGHGATCSCP